MKTLSKLNLNKFRVLFEEQKLFLLSRKETDIVNGFESGDEVDIAQSIVINSMLEKLSSRDKETLMKINDAIKRIDAGTFGLCEECEETIGEKRLQAIPYCVTCISCAEQQERVAKQYYR